MNHKFYKDYYRMTGKEWHGSIKDYLSLVVHHNLQYMYLVRKNENKQSRLVRTLLHRLTLKYGIEISVDAKLAEGLYLGHPYNITVAEGVQIGRNVNLHKGCTIGRENRGKRVGVPVIGNNVWIGINAVVIGNISIGDDVLIAPGCFVNRDIPSHSVVLGNPCTVHSSEHATYGYINYTE